MRLVLAGTPEFARTVFEIILNRSAGKYEIAAVLTNPARKGDRGKISEPPAAIFANDNKIPLLRFERVSKDGVSALRALNADIMVTAAFGQILSDEILEIFPRGVINVHGSLLPKYRGASPVQSAIMSGEHESGITVMRTVREVDAGDVILSRALEIGKTETAGELFARLAELGGYAVLDALEEIDSGRAVFVPQASLPAPASAPFTCVLVRSAGNVSFTKQIQKADCALDFSRTPDELDCFVRALSPSPRAYFTYANKIIKVLRLTKSAIDSKFIVNNNGFVLVANPKDGLTVCVNGGAVEILELQAEGGKPMSARDYLRGHEIRVGSVLS